MTGKSKTPLLKKVCEHAALMRTQFYGSSWASKTNQTDRKIPVVNKAGLRFRKKIEKLSVAKSWLEIQKEWIIIKQHQLFKQSEQCLCGRGNLKFATYLKNKKNNKEITAGNCCLLTFKR